MTEEQLNNQLTQLWQRLIAVENKILDVENSVKTEQEIVDGHDGRLTTPEAARKVQITLNERFSRAMKANPDKNESTSSWWKKLVG